MVDWLSRLRTGTLEVWNLPWLWDNQHPVGAEVGLTAIAVAVLGLHFKAVVYLSFAVVVATAAAACGLARGAAAGPLGGAVVSLSMVLLAFHPFQMEHLLWAFELGWFMVNACVVANALLVERLGRRSIGPVAFLCLVASFSSAQGAFSWFTAALHVGVRCKDERRWLAVVALAACGAVAAGRIALRSASLGQAAPADAETPIELATFAVQIVGTVVGTRNHAALLLIGGAALLLIGSLAFRLWRRGGGSARLRSAGVLAVFSLLSVLGFAQGRMAYGLDWALGSFHAAPLLIPLAFGAVLLVAEATRAPGRDDRVALALALPLALLLATGWCLSWAYGAKRARLWAMDRGYARWAACGRAVPIATAERAAGAEPYRTIFAEAQGRLSAMCTDHPSALELRLVAEPALFARLAATRPDARQALDAIWQDYATDIALQLAFDPERPTTPARLLAFAKAEAAGRLPPDHVRWIPYAEVLTSLP